MGKLFKKVRVLRNNRNKKACIIMIFLIAVVIIACGKKELKDKKVIIYAAASMTESLSDAVEEITEKHPDIEIKVSFNSSSKLRLQIEQGADVDIYISASKSQYDKLKEKVDFEKDKKFLSNEIIIAVNNKNNIEKWNEIHRDYKVLKAEDYVPAGEYANKLLKKLNGIENGFSEKVLSNVVSEEINVKQVVNKLYLGEGDVGFIYNTDLTEKVKDRLYKLDVPEEMKVKSNYYICLLKNEEDNIEVFNELLSYDIKKIFRKYGFSIVKN
ncbi:molybdate ABC transporter substrate-binding protein [Oceanirhabdus sp. W0125-5]|uniref:molybdate ABC transporter substrate-binding protein n=1 Tax=Oceanirhabdus sp. W0125-5 TaxID=2999116 RepID=UPI0022F2C676|nr:molybdate ABC transporter substrate-binding protein [Oceanirhabdus sp. W0125-5]WBW97868.1 molybdate ABC transporter substrate-binding protein [Oceanirhabdus sp. W0125-5]